MQNYTFLKRKKSKGRLIEKQTYLSRTKRTLNFVKARSDSKEEEPVFIPNGTLCIIQSHPMRELLKKVHGGDSMWETNPEYTAQ